MSPPRAWTHKRRFGWPGTEPHEVRNPIAQWGALLVAIGGLAAASAGGVQVSAALALVALIVGLPRPWVWANDRPSALCWTLAAALLIAAEIVWLAGGASTHASLAAAHGGAGAPALLIGASILVQLLGYFRRWGSQGNSYYALRMARRGDPAALANARERAVRIDDPEYRQD